MLSLNLIKNVTTKKEIRKLKQTVYLLTDLELSYDSLPFVFYLAKQNIVVFFDEYDFDTYIHATEKIDNLDNLLQYLNLYEHAYKTSYIVSKIMKKLNYDTSTIQIVTHATLLHDIGKMCISQSLLQSIKRFNEVEKEYVKLHTIYGRQIINYLNLTEYVKYIAKRLSYTHHERLDGSGYPTGKNAYELNTIDRIIAIADVYSAVTEERSYRSSCDDELAISLLKNSNKFDQNIVSILEKIIYS